MKSQYLKDLYYLSLGKLSIFSLYYNRLRCRSKRFSNAFVNMGCGANYVKGMINIDGNIFRKKDIWLDITLGLPFSKSSIQGVYASHIIEHFNASNVRGVFAELYRVLKPGGGIRIILPSLEYAIKSYSEGKTSNLPEWPERYDSIGGRFNNFMLCANQHFLMFDFSFLEELLSKAGFRKIVREEARKSHYFKKEHMQFEAVDNLNDSSLYIECCK